MSSLSAERQQIKQLRKVRKQLKKPTIPNGVYMPHVRPVTEYIHYDNKSHMYNKSDINKLFYSTHLVLSDIFIFMECILKYVSIQEWKQFMKSTVKYKNNIIKNLCLDRHEEKKNRVSSENLTQLYINSAKHYNRNIFEYSNMLGFIFRIDKIIYKYVKKLPIRVNTLQKTIVCYKEMNYANYAYPKYFIDLLYKIKFYHKNTISRKNIPIFIHGASRKPLVTYNFPKPLYKKKITIQQLTEKKLNRYNIYKLEIFTKYLENTSYDDVYSIIAVPDIMDVISTFITGIPNKTYKAQITQSKKLDYSS